MQPLADSGQVSIGFYPSVCSSGWSYNTAYNSRTGVSIKLRPTMSGTRKMLTVGDCGIYEDQSLFSSYSWSIQSVGVSVTYGATHGTGSGPAALQSVQVLPGPLSGAGGPYNTAGQTRNGGSWTDL